MSRFESALNGTDHQDEFETGRTSAQSGTEPVEADSDARAGSEHGVRLAETTRSWMRLGEHAARLRGVCLDAGLGERLTTYLVGAFLIQAQDTAKR